MTRTLFLLLALAMTVAAPLAAHAQHGTPPQTPLSPADDARARLHFQSGVDDFNTADYQSALDEFNRAYELSHRPTLLNNISLTYERLGDVPHAVEFLQRYLDEGHDDPALDRPTLEAKLANLRRRLPAAGTGTTTTTTTATTGTTGTTTSGTGETGTGQTTTQTTTATGTETTAQTAGTGITEPAPTTPVGGGGGGVPMAALISWIVAGVGLLDFAIVGPLALAGDSSLSSGCGATHSCTDSDVSGQRTLNLVADIGWITAIAAGALGTVLFFTMQSHDDHPPPVALAPWVSPRADAAGLSLSGRL